MPTTALPLDREHALRAVRSRDARFDGWLYLAVVTTGIYCRPSCPAVTPKPENTRFFPSAAAAQHAGFRACKRCRPDASPGSPEWNARGDVVARAMRLIADGVVDREGVTGLAARLGYSVRQLERQLTAELGAGPLALARAQRAQAARVLLETTALSITDVAFAAGFASIRAFNDTVREVFALAPTQLRGGAPARTSRVAVPGDGGTLSLRLPFRRPLHPDSLFGHLIATGVPGVEEWRDGTYRRTLRLPHGTGVVALIPPLGPAAGHITARLTLTDLRDLQAAISRCRRLLDLDADPVAVDAELSRDPALRPLVAAAGGRRVPRSTDPTEMALRAVLGQQVSVAAARTLAGRLVRRHGQPLADPHGGLTHLFPEPGVLAGLAASELAMPAGRARTLLGLARVLADGRIDLEAGADWREARAALSGVPGLGPWSVELIAMRALGDPDAFPATDLGVRRGAEACGLPPAAAALRAASASWAPWRSYAVQYLWGATDHPVNRLPEPRTPAHTAAATGHTPQDPSCP